MPPKHSLRSDDLRYILQRLPSESFGDLGQADALRLSEPYSPLDLVAEDSILRHQTFVSKKDFLLH